MKTGKPWWASKTILANLVSLIASIFDALGVINIDGGTQATIVLGLSNITNIVLRFATELPVTVKKPETSAPSVLLMLFVVGGLLSACAVRTAETPGQKAYALAGTYEAIAIEATSLMKTGTVPDDIVAVIGKANDIAEPAVLILLKAAQSYTVISDEITEIRERGHDPPKALIESGRAALDELTAEFSTTQPLVQNLIDAVKRAKGDDS